MDSSVIAEAYCSAKCFRPAECYGSTVHLTERIFPKTAPTILNNLF